MPTNNSARILIVRMHHRAGFFSHLTFAIHQFRYAEAHGLRPVVYFGPRSGRRDEPYYDPAYGDNVWDYFFEPACDCTYDDVKSRLASGELAERDITRLSHEELWRLHRENPDSIYPYPPGCQRDVRVDRAWYERQRARPRPYLKRYVRVKPTVLDEVDRFGASELTGRPVIGVHLRGTDKEELDLAPGIVRVVPPAEYFPGVDAFLERRRDARVFLATDQSEFAAAFRARYGGRLAARDSIRGRGRGRWANPFRLPGGGYRKGLDVLVDCLLLARCDFLVKCTSAVGEFALCFNEELEYVDLNVDPEPRR